MKPLIGNPHTGKDITLRSKQVARGVNVQKKREHADRVTVREARAAEVDYIRRLSKKVFQQYGPYEDILARWFELGTVVTLLALTEKRPVGFAMVGRIGREWYPPGVSELLAVAVEPAKWRLGIGHLLMNRAERDARAQNFKILILHTAVENVPAQKLFKKHGFAVLELKKNFYPKGQDALMMYKDIA